MVRGNFQCRSVLLLFWIIVGQVSTVHAVSADGVVSLDYHLFFFFLLQTTEIPSQRLLKTETTTIIFINS